MGNKTICSAQPQRGLWWICSFVVIFLSRKDQIWIKKNEGAFIGEKNGKTKKIKYELLDPSIYVVFPWIEE